VKQQEQQNFPSEIKVKEASAKFQDSVLTIKLPKIEKKVHKIDID
jgi:HSP20 family protein